MNEILNELGVLLLRVAWTLRMIHVPYWDNVPFPNVEESTAPDTQQAPEPILAPVIQGQTKTYEYGSAAPGQRPELHNWIEIEETDTEADLGWSFTRYDGKHGSRDLTAWSPADDKAIQHLTPYKQRIYLQVRPLVLQGMTNQMIANECGYKLRWADEHAGRVRAALATRIKAMTPSPT